MIRGRSNEFTKISCGKCIAPTEFAVRLSSTKESSPIHGSLDESHPATSRPYD